MQATCLASHSEQQWRPEVLVLGPGGVKGYLELGALLRFDHEDGYFDSIHTFVGCSIGAATALLLVCGYKTIDIIKTVVDMNVLAEVHSGFSIDDIGKNKGLLKNSVMETNLIKLLEDKFGSVPTLKGLHRLTGKKLMVVTTNCDRESVEYLSCDTEPDLSCVQAVMMSSALPFVMQKRYYNGCSYIDGALGNPYPIDYYDDGETNILGIYIDGRRGGDKTWLDQVAFFIHFAMTANRERIIRSASDRCRNLPLRSTIIDSVGITVSMEDKANMISQGYSSANEFLGYQCDGISDIKSATDDGGSDLLRVINDMACNDEIAFTEDE